MRYLIICALSIFSIAFAQGQTIERDWDFAAITNTAGDSIYKIFEADTFSLEDGAFTYSLASKDNLQAAGDYMYQDNLLVLFFSQPKDTIRRYRIKELTDTSLRFTENEVTYSFTSPSQEEAMSAIIPETSHSNLQLDASQSVGVSTNSIGRGLIGMVFLLLVCFLLSANRRKINWRLVATGLALQVIFAVLVLKVSYVASIFDFISRKV